MGITAKEAVDAYRAAQNGTAIEARRPEVKEAKSGRRA
jgi:hypothetical protein